MIRPKPTLYANARRLIRDGDVALYKVGPNGKFSNLLIARVGKSPYVHAGMLFHGNGDRLLLAETLQWYGGRMVRFSKQVKSYSGQWDIYRPRQPYNVICAVLEMEDGVDRRYGWGSLFRAALGHTRFISRLLPPIPDTAVADGAPAFCSQLVSAACCAGGRDPQPDLTDAVTEPRHLADPKFAKYLFTVYWDELPKVAL